MKKRSRMLYRVVLIVVALLSVVTIVDATDHEHEWELKGSAEKAHGMKCNICGAYVSVEHTFDSNNICTVCAYEKHEHNYQCVKREYSFHTMVCQGCGDKKTTTHSYINSRTCSVCGYSEHTHIWQFNGETFDDKHGVKCTMCDTITTQDCTFGDDGVCTVCGRKPAHWHDYNIAKPYSDRYHILECECGKTTQEEHRMLGWDGELRTDYMHGIICGICGEKMIQAHFYNFTYENGEVCVMCDYEKAKHTWEYDNSYDDESHGLICSDCNKTKSEAHKPNSKGNCSVCGYHVYDVTETNTKPAETRPIETQPAEIKPIETRPVETEPIETRPVETEPIETQPVETEPAATKPINAFPDETTAAATIPATSDIASEIPVEDDVQQDWTLWMWISIAAVAVLGGFGIAFIIWKKKAS